MTTFEPLYQEPQAKLAPQERQSLEEVDLLTPAQRDAWLLNYKNETVEWLQEWDEYEPTITDPGVKKYFEDFYRYAKTYRGELIILESGNEQQIQKLYLRLREEENHG